MNRKSLFEIGIKFITDAMTETSKCNYALPCVTSKTLTNFSTLEYQTSLLNRLTRQKFISMPTMIFMTPDLLNFFQKFKNLSYKLISMCRKDEMKALLVPHNVYYTPIR